VIALVVGAVAGSAQGQVQPRVVQGPDWVQVEEPALRPFKGFWEGTKAFGYHSKMALASGNVKFPFFGSIEVLRGVRRGSIELVSNTYNSMGGSYPRPYGKMGRTNQFIEGDPLLRHVADAVTYAGVYSVANVSNLGGHVIGTLAAQKVVDQAPVNPEMRRAISEERRYRRERVRQAQEAYVGPRASINPAPPGRGDLLRPYR
jgi:hypothetical protein